MGALKFARPDCPVDAYCITSLGGVSESCGDGAYLSPMPLAEELCYQALKDRSNRSKTKTPAQRLAKAWSLIECSLANEDLEDSEQEFGEGTNYLRSVLQESDLNVAWVMGARVLEAALPQFRCRQAGNDPSDDDLAVVHMGFGSALEWAIHTPDFRNDAEREGALLYGVLGCLGNRTLDEERMLFPASLRESKLGGPDFASRHHQYYAIMDGDKVPATMFMAKHTGRHDGTSLVAIKYAPFISQALRILENQGLRLGYGKAVQRTPQLLADEALGREVSEPNLELLQALTGLLHGYIGNHASAAKRRGERDPGRSALSLPWDE